MDSDEAAPARREGRVAIANGLVEVTFDLRAGTYRIVSRRDPLARIEGARFGLAGVAGVALAAGGSAPLTASTREVAGPLGRGRCLTVTAAAGGLHLLLEIELYEGKGFVVLGAGVDNRTGGAIRLGRICPIVATAFNGQDVGKHFAVLDGTSGCLPTRVQTGARIASRNNLLAKFGRRPTRCLVVGGLTYHDFEKFARIDRKEDRIELECWGEDPVGRRVEAGERYVPDDRAYVDIGSRDPFAALETYAWAVRLAQGIELPTYDFPTVCLWWASQVGPKANDSVGAVGEMDHVVASGFLKYSRVGVRLLPDCYEKNNCDGWWDDEHWARCSPTFAEPGACYKPPYETTRKWCRAVIERGGVPIGYFRANGRSDDYAAAHPGHMLHNDPARRIARPVGKRWWERNWPAEEQDLVGYDFTDPDFLRHMREVYAELKSAGLAGVFYDYPKITGWCHEGGFEDPLATTARAYRNIFQVARDGLGRGALLQERAYHLGSDVSLGTVASQRTIWDNTTWAPPVIARAALRWYKNRVVIHYDTDGKQVLDEYARNGRDGGRAMFTMTYVASGRLLLANSFAQMTPQQLHDLSRVIPFHAAPQSARPLDLFDGGPCPRVYDFRVDDSWHQLTFYNTAVEGGRWPSIDVDLEPGTEGRRDFPGKVRALKPADGAVAVELGAPPAEGGLGLDAARRYYVYDFWNDRLVGVFAGSDRLEQELRPCEARMMSVHAVEPVPQFLSTDRHVMQGYVDFVGRPAWDAAAATLKGTSRLIGGETCKVVIAANGHRLRGCSAAGAAARARTIDVAAGLLELSLDARENAEVAWGVRFEQGAGK